MIIEEMTNIAKAAGWAYGPCGAAQWPEIEQTYNRTDLTKGEITYAYWMRTGLYEKAAQAVKEMIEWEQKMVADIRDGAFAERIETRCHDLAYAAGEVRLAVENIKTAYAGAKVKKGGAQ